MFRFILLFLSCNLFILQPASAGVAPSCEQAFEASHLSISLTTVDVDTAISLAGLNEHKDLLRAQSRGLISFQDFLPFWKTQPTGYLLGLSSGHPIYHALSSPVGLLGWSDGYFKHRIYPRANDHTRTYMEAITATDELIVFIVPSNLMTTPSITQNEMRWLLSAPRSKLANVLFVFGAYDAIPSQLLQQLKKEHPFNGVRQYLQTLQ